MIDLLYAEPGTIFKCRNEMRLRFTNRVVGAPPGGKCYRLEIVGVHGANGAPIETHRFRYGSLTESGEISGSDIVSVESDPPKIDLSTVSPGWPVRLRNGTIQRLTLKSEHANEGRPYKIGMFYYSHDGHVSLNKASSPLDVVCILNNAEAHAYESATKQEPDKKVIGLPMETFPIGTKFRRRDGKITTLIALDPDNKTYPFQCQDGNEKNIYTSRGRYLNGEQINPKDLVKVFKAEREKPLTKDEILPALAKLVSKLSKPDAAKAKILLEALK